MTITAVAATYRVRIADRGATVVTGNVALTLALADLSEVPTISGPSVDILAAGTTSHPFDLKCIVDTVLFVASSRMAVIGRLCEIQRSTDDGGSWSTLATGRIQGASEIGELGQVTLRVSDERWVERDSEMFVTTSTMQLHPPGLASAFMGEPVAVESVYTVLEVSGAAVKIQAEEIAGPTFGNQAPASLREALASDLVPTEDRVNTAANSAGNFTDLVFRWTETNGTPITASNNKVIGFRQTLGAGNLSSTGIGGLLGQMSPEGDGVIQASWVYLGAGHGLVATDEITGRYYWPNEIALNENVPLHIGGVDGIHPMTLLKDILDGDYGGDPVLYNAAAITALEALSMPPVWVRATEPVDRAEWLEKNLYPVFNVAPLVGTDLAPRPTALRLGQGVVPGSLTTIDATGASSTDWDHTSRDLVTVLRFSSQALRRLSDTADLGNDWPADRFEAIRQRVEDITHDNVATLGRVAHKVETDLIVSRSSQGFTTMNDVSRVLAAEIFEVFGDGPIRGTVTVPDDAGVEVGDLVVLDQDTLLGFNPNTSGRTGDRIVRVISFRERTPAYVVFEWLDLGPSSSALSAPTVAITQDGTDPDLVNVALSGMASGEKAVVEVTAAASPPTTYDYRRAVAINSTSSFRIDSGSGNAYARAYAYAPNRIRSTWATDSVALSTRPLITTAKVTRALTTATVTWTVPSNTLGMRTRYDIHNRNEAPTFASQTDYDAADGGFSISGLIGTGDMVSVELEPWTGWTGSAVSGTAGNVLVIEALLQKIDGGIFLPRAPLTSVSYERDADGEAVVSVAGDEEARTIYVTVGNGSTPSDPTAGANDGSLTGRSGTISTGVAITTGNAAIVKAVSADAGGMLGPVSTFRFGSRIGPILTDTGSTHTGNTTETDLQVITIPGGVLGTDGSIHIEAVGACTGGNDTKRLRVYLGATLVGDVTFAAGFTGQQYHMLMRLYNDGAVNSQRVVVTIVSEDDNVYISNSSAAVGSGSDVDVDITGTLANASDTISVSWAEAYIVGTV